MKIVVCPDCGFGKQVIRVHPRTVEEIYPKVTREGLKAADEPSDRGYFYCAQCNLDFSATGVTYKEHLGLKPLR